MRGIELQSYGDPSVGIKMVGFPEPSSPGAGEILVKIDYAPLNLHDVLVLQGYFPFHPELPSAVGNEGVGTVLAVGPDVSDIAVGAVVVLPLFGLTWRERAVFSASDVVVVPTGGDLQQYSMLRGNAVTASLLLSEYTALKPGDWIIQNAGNSSVARCVVAFAREQGVKTISLVRREEALGDAIASGADAVFVDDDSALEKIRKLVGENGVKLAIDGVGGSAVTGVVAPLAVGGVAVSYGTVGGDYVAKLSMVDVIFKDITYRGFYVDRAQYHALYPAIIKKAAEMVLSGKLNVPIAGAYGLQDIGKALDHVAKGGKVLLKP